MSSPSLPLQSQRTKFPGMRPIEGQVMRLWLREHESEYDRFEYNVRVGPGRDPGPTFSDQIRKGAILSSQWRLDALGWREGRPTIIEVKNYAQVPAIAQLSLYGAVWNAEHQELQPAALLIVCSNAEPGFVNAATAANIAVQMIAPH